MNKPLKWYTPLTPSFFTGYNDLSVATTSQFVKGFSPNTTYYYRVRAIRTNSTSVNSNIVSVLILTTGLDFLKPDLEIRAENGQLIFESTAVKQ